MNYYFVIVVIVLLIMVVVSISISSNNANKLSNLMKYSEDGDLVEALEKYYNKVEELSKRINSKTDMAIIQRIDELEAKNLSSFCRMGAVNFDAFDDVKGSLSFALTLLDDCGDGFILTSLYGHNSCNTYIRKIKNGQTQTKLLKEEQESLEMAKNGVHKDEE